MLETLYAQCREPQTPVLPGAESSQKAVLPNPAIQSILTSVTIPSARGIVETVGQKFAKPREEGPAATKNVAGAGFVGKAIRRAPHQTFPLVVWGCGWCSDRCPSVLAHEFMCLCPFRATIELVQ